MSSFFPFSFHTKVLFIPNPAPDCGGGGSILIMNSAPEHTLLSVPSALNSSTCFFTPNLFQERERANSKPEGGQAVKVELPPAVLYKGATIPHKLTGMYHNGQLDAENTLTHRYFPYLGDKGFARPICGLESAPGHMPPGWEGPKKLNQDRGCICYPVQGNSSSGIFGVFDGHGTEGQRVSEYAIVQLWESLKENPILLSDPGKALRQSFKGIDKSIKSVKHVDTTDSGSTACVLYMKGSHLHLSISNLES